MRSLLFIETEGAWIDIGIKKLMYIDKEQLIYQPDVYSTHTFPEKIDNSLLNFSTSPQDILRCDRTYQFVINYKRDRYNKIEGYLSLAKIHSRIIWQRLTQLEAEAVLISARICQIKQYGAIAIVEGIYGFIPNSHISDFHLSKPKAELIGEYLNLEILEVNEELNKLILSYSLPIKKRRIKQLKIGRAIAGKICAIKPYGIFVDIKDIRALLPKAEIPPTNSKFIVGEKIKVKIKHIDDRKFRVTLALDRDI